MEQPSEFDPDWVVPPGWILEERLEVNNISVTECAEHCARPIKYIEDFLVGSVPLDSELASRLATLFDLDTEMWLALEDGYREGLARNKKVPQFAAE